MNSVLYVKVALAIMHSPPLDVSEDAALACGTGRATGMGMWSRAGADSGGGGGGRVGGGADGGGGERATEGGHEGDLTKERWEMGQVSFILGLHHDHHLLWAGHQSPITDKLSRSPKVLDRRRSRR